ncbi:MAG: amidohydrolase family protein [Clostridia bacterium]|nr:amidohydrolase family protein [Clostridia bacterium]
MEKILIKNGRLWDGKRFIYTDLLTEGEKIACIEPEVRAEASYIYDAAGKTVLPGMVDLHAHLKGISSDRYGIQAEMASLPFGVTAVNDGGAVQGDRALAEGLGVKNTVFVSVGIQNNCADLAAAERLLLRYGERAVGLKVYFDTEVSEVRDLAPLREVVAYAAGHGLKVMVHCSHSPTPMAEIVEALSPGDILTHVYHGGIHSCGEQDHAALRFAREKGVVLDAGFAGHVHTDPAVLRAAFDAGFYPDTLSTDITRLSVYRRGGRYGLPLCMSVARSCGMEEQAIFRAVTSAPAAILGQPQWGILQVGNAADVAVLEEGKEAFSLGSLQGEKSYRCVLTVLDGQVVYRD